MKMLGGNHLHQGSEELVGKSKPMQEIKKLISLVGPSNVPVLILGETGTGKELIARAVHKTSNRSKGPFVTVNVGALPESILENELFGHGKGAFTGAQVDKAGLVEIADRGTFFGDEVGEMPLVMQGKLLRVIETGTFRRLGETRETKVNVRLVCATNKDLEEEVRQKNFRADLFYRLSTFIIRVPPLRERMEDIPLLVDYFLSRFAAVAGGARKHLARRGLDRLMEYHWPGNVRELANVLERAVLLSCVHTEIPVDALALDTRGTTFMPGQENGNRRTMRLRDVEREYVAGILETVEGNKARAARLLGISRTKIYSLLGAC